ncbi:MAG: ATP synthase subunit I [Arenicellales bacterium]|nr:ATP synthase subunit I [Arenicellales bacterium]
MKTTVSNGAGSPLVRVVAAQAALVLVCLLVHVFYGEAISFSVLVGAGIGAMGVGYAAWRVFWRPTEWALSGTSELATLYRAEVGKLAIIGGLCAVVFVLSDAPMASGLVIGLLLSMMVSSLSAILGKTPLALITE